MKKKEKDPKKVDPVMIAKTLETHLPPVIDWKKMLEAK